MHRVLSGLQWPRPTRPRASTLGSASAIVLTGSLLRPPLEQSTQVTRWARPSWTPLSSVPGPRPAAAQHPAGAEQQGRAGRSLVVARVFSALLLDGPGPPRPSRHRVHLGRPLVLLLPPLVAGGGRGAAARFCPALRGGVCSHQDVSARKAAEEGEAASRRHDACAHQLAVVAG